MVPDTTNEPSTIALRGGVGFLSNYDEGKCGATDILPGMLIEQRSTALFHPHATRGGRHGGQIAIEEVFTGNVKETAYTSGARIRFMRAQRGDEFLMHLKAGENVSIGDWLVSAGDGTLVKQSEAYLANNVAASSAISNTTTETTFSNGTVTIPKNSVRAGTVIRFRGQGIATSTNSTDTLKVKGYIGSTALFDTGALDVANNDTFWFDGRITFRTVGASGTLVAEGTVTIGTAGTVTVKHFYLASTAVDTTEDMTLTFKATWSVASASNSCRLDVLTVERVEATSGGTQNPAGGEPVGQAVEASDLSAETENGYLRVRIA